MTIGNDADTVKIEEAKGKALAPSMSLKKNYFFL
jgi:hypothetical protein